MSLSIGELAQRCGATLLRGDPKMQVASVQIDSRAVGAGAVFVAMGDAASGFISDAVRRGASAVVLDPARVAAPAGDIPILGTGDPAAACSALASALAGDPFSRMVNIGITGTNGKTTTAAMVTHILAQEGHRPATIGTLGASFGAHRWPSQFTTPPAPELMRVGKEVADLGATHVVMEVSSIALCSRQRRADAIRFAAAGITNVTQDHLDFHGTMEAYADAKGRLLGQTAAAAIVVGDGYTRRMASTSPVPTIRIHPEPSTAVSSEMPTKDDWTILQRTERANGQEVALKAGDLSLSFRLPMVGAFNATNATLALALCSQVGVPVSIAAAHLASMPAVRGRLEACHGPDDTIEVYVDYAHTPDALERALKALSRGRKPVCVFGCGGNRDQGKRPLMGNIAATLSSRVILTNDNPRGEEPTDILRQIRTGIGSAADVVIEPDRQRAIDLAIANAEAGTIILVAGKGHETGQTEAGVTRPFDDAAECKRALAVRRAAR